jgi:hypothetical protein
MTVFENYSDDSLISSQAFNNYGKVVIATRLLLEREATPSYVGYAPY